MNGFARQLAATSIALLGSFASVGVAGDLRMAAGATVVIATPGAPPKLVYEIDPGGIRPLTGAGLIFGNTKHEYADQLTARLHDAGFDVASCLSSGLKDQLTKRGMHVREAGVDHRLVLGYPQRLPQQRRPVIADSEFLLDPVIQEFGFVVKRKERVRLTMAVSAWIDSGSQSWRSPLLAVNPTQMARMMRSKPIEIPGLTTWRDRMELEVNVEDVSKGFGFACQEMARALVDEFPW